MSDLEDRHKNKGAWLTNYIKLKWYNVDYVLVTFRFNKFIGLRALLLVIGCLNNHIIKSKLLGRAQYCQMSDILSAFWKERDKDHEDINHLR